MTFEEKIDRLAERHEALTQSVELLYRDMQQQMRRIDAIASGSEKDGEPMRTLARIAEDTLDSIKRLESIASAHQNRIEDLEKR